MRQRSGCLAFLLKLFDQLRIPLQTQFMNIVNTTCTGNELFNVLVELPLGAKIAVSCLSQHHFAQYNTQYKNNARTDTCSDPGRIFTAFLKDCPYNKKCRDRNRYSQNVKTGRRQPKRTAAIWGGPLKSVCIKSSWRLLVSKPVISQSLLRFINFSQMVQRVIYMARAC